MNLDKLDRYLTTDPRENAPDCDSCVIRDLCINPDKCEGVLTGEIEDYLDLSSLIGVENETNRFKRGRTY